jgi:hypothetical protein
MIGFLSSISFIYPWILSGLLFLPALWYLLKVTPPAPKHIFFPAARFLFGLRHEDQTSSKTPWWILLIRLLAAAFLIIALAKPVLNISTELPGKDTLRLVIDNGWESAQLWDMQIDAASNLLEQASRERREVYILTTAPEPGKADPFYQGPITASEASAILRGLTPYPWPSEYKKSAALIKDKTATKKGIFSVWLSTGIDGDGHKLLSNALQNAGGLKFIEPEENNLPLLLSLKQGAANELTVRVSAPRTIENGLPVLIETQSASGKLIDVQRETLSSAELPLRVALDIPPSLRNQIGKISLSGRKGAGALILLDNQNKRKLVSILAPEGQAETAPFIEDSYYLIRALEPYADIEIGGLDKIIKAEPSVIILPDIGALNLDELTKLEKWVKNGGLLLRFAGPNMTQGESFLTPVPLLQGGRALDGSLTWEEPIRIAPFDEQSPFYGLSVDEEITVKRQLLAAPDADSAEKTWATLEDGTPLITAAPLGNGLLTLIHTTATPDWSDLPLSGLYVQLLRRIVNLSPGSIHEASSTGTLKPQLMLNGMGEQTQPESYVIPIKPDQFDTLIPSSSHPPGIYGRTGYQRALNIGDNLIEIKALKPLPLSVQRRFYDGQKETDLMPFLFVLSFCLFLADWMIMLFFQLKGRFLLKPYHAAFLIFMLITPAEKALAEEKHYADDLYLAYIKSASSEVNQIANDGLTALASILSMRTSVEPAGVIGLNPEVDELSFFPFIYWPISSNEKPLSDKAVKKVQYYIDHGGTILFDTRDRLSTPKSIIGAAGGVNQKALQRTVGALNIPPLVPMNEEHVLLKTFYLLPIAFPGKFQGGTVWVTENSMDGRDAVSSVIIGGHDWASAWSAGAGNSSLLSGGPRHQEMAVRTGVNLMMYALTGNYKADQVHLPHILERLGQ